MSAIASCIEREGREIVVVIDYDYQPRERATQTYPGCSESVAINHIDYKSPVTEPCTPAELERITIEILESEDEQHRNDSA